jgi:hypothetical protein
MPFASIMLKTVCSVTGKYGGTLGVAIGGLLCELLLSIFWIMTIIGIVAMTSREENCRYEMKNGRREEVCDIGVYVGVLPLYIFAIFSIFWTAQVIRNVVHVTICGVFGTFYFLEGTPQMPRGSATLGALKRSLTTAFGTICFGSLIVAVIETIRAIMKQSDSDDGAVSFSSAICSCLLAYIQALIEYFNNYAFAQVAIYGKPFCQACKDTWALIKDRGVEAIINDSLVDNVLSVGTFFIAFLTCGFGYLYLNSKGEGFIEDNQGFTAIVLIGCFITGLVMMSMIAGVINSGVVSTFVALAEDPMALARTKPELFEKIRQTWPDVVVGVRG